jgi:hypothetical protein
MRPPPQLGQSARPLHEKATSRSKPREIVGEPAASENTRERPPHPPVLTINGLVDSASQGPQRRRRPNWIATPVVFLRIRSRSGLTASQRVAAPVLLVAMRACFPGAPRRAATQRDSVTIGSTFIARRAGANDASAAMASSAAAIAPNVTGSNGLMPNSI